VNKVLEAARSEKLIGASLESKVFLCIPDPDLKAQISTFIDPDPSNGVDELRYFFLASDVEIVESATAIAALDFKSDTEMATIGVTQAAGAKCDRCWNYAESVGHHAEHPQLCDRCFPTIEALINQGKLAQDDEGAWKPVKA